tara:strand:+ start:261 stop:749 length:489 start_codon:yes stop_codon:yes gene_type:complete
MAKPVSVDLNKLKLAFNYNSIEGVIKWTQINGSGKKSEVAGSIGVKGYIKLTLSGRTYLAHRVAWAIHYNEQPPKIIDHINGNKSDNRIVNLRDGTNCVNQQNQTKPHSRNKTSNYIGVSKFKSRWRAKIYHDKSYYFLGYFEDEKAASNAYLAAKQKLHKG